MKGAFFLPGRVPTNPVFHALYPVLEELPRTRRLRAGLASQFGFAIITTDLQVSGEVAQPQRKRQGAFSTDCHPEGVSPKPLNKGMLLPPEVKGFAHKS